MRTEDVLDQIDGALEDWGVGPDAMRLGAPAGTAPSSRSPEFRMRITVDVSRLNSAFERMQEALAEMAPKFTAAMRVLARHFPQPASPYDEHHPKPLCIDGHEYARRRRNRSKR